MLFDDKHYRPDSWVKRYGGLRPCEWCNRLTRCEDLELGVFVCSDECADQVRYLQEKQREP
jgi:hypothetical protein